MVGVSPSASDAVAEHVRVSSLWGLVGLIPISVMAGPVLSTVAVATAESVALYSSVTVAVQVMLPADESAGRIVVVGPVSPVDHA